MFCCFIKKSNSNIMNTPEEVFKDSNWSNSQPFQPDLKIGKVIKVYDGDSITIAAKPYENYPIYRFSVRLSGIDTPELRTRNENEKKHAIIARDALSEKILDKIVTLKNVESEKYGRVLADVYLGDENICEWMVANNYGVQYGGKTKVKPKEWFEDVE